MIEDFLAEIVCNIPDARLDWALQESKKDDTSNELDAFTLLYFLLARGATTYLDKYPKADPALRARVVFVLSRLLAISSGGATVISPDAYLNLLSKGGLPISPYLNNSSDDIDTSKILVMEIKHLDWALTMAYSKAGQSLTGPDWDAAKARLHARIAAITGRAEPGGGEFSGQQSIDSDITFDL
jgi:hypothetical protein